jgi:hypothetical protein
MEQVVQRFAIGEALTEIGGLQAQRFVAERLRDSGRNVPAVIINRMTPRFGAVKLERA